MCGPEALADPGKVLGGCLGSYGLSPSTALSISPKPYILSPEILALNPVEFYALSSPP